MPVVVLKVQTWPPTVFVNSLLTGPVKPVRPKVPPNDLVVVFTKVQEPEVNVTAEVSTVKIPFNVALPAPVILLFVAASVMTNFIPPVLLKTSDLPLLTVVLPV